MAADCDRRNALPWMALPAIVLTGLFLTACNPTDTSQAPNLQLLAVPASITTNSQTSLLLTVTGACATGTDCTVCLGEAAPTDPTGTLYAPFDPSQGVVSTALQIDTADYASSSYPLTVIYQAPAVPGTRVVYATLLASGGLCAKSPDAGLPSPTKGQVMAVTTVSIGVQPQSEGSTTPDASGDSGTGG
jgi:hypothetical protein